MYKKIFGFACLSALCFLIIKNQIDRKSLNEKIDAGVLSIGKIYNYSSGNRYHYYSFYYYCNGFKTVNQEDISEPFLGESSVGRFFYIRYLKDNPAVSKIYLMDEALDTSLILKAGLKMKETNDYIYNNNGAYIKQKTIRIN